MAWHAVLVGVLLGSATPARDDDDDYLRGPHQPPAPKTRTRAPRSTSILPKAATTTGPVQTERYVSPTPPSRAKEASWHHTAATTSLAPIERAAKPMRAQHLPSATRTMAPQHLFQDGGSGPSQLARKHFHTHTSHAHPDSRSSKLGGKRRPDR